MKRPEEEEWKANERNQRKGGYAGLFPNSSLCFFWCFCHAPHRQGWAVCGGSFGWAVDWGFLGSQVLTPLSTSIKHTNSSASSSRCLCVLPLLAVPPVALQFNNSICCQSSPSGKTQVFCVPQRYLSELSLFYYRFEGIKLIGATCSHFPAYAISC